MKIYDKGKKLNFNKRNEVIFHVFFLSFAKKRNEERKKREICDKREREQDFNKRNYVLSSCFLF